MGRISPSADANNLEIIRTLRAYTVRTCRYSHPRSCDLYLEIISYLSIVTISPPCQEIHALGKGFGPADMSVRLRAFE
jgi:hypothetical protein